MTVGVTQRLKSDETFKGLVKPELALIASWSIAKGITHLVNRNVEGWIAHGIHGDYVITMVLHLVVSIRVISGRISHTIQSTVW